MSHPCFSLILIVLVALSGCSRSQSSDPSRRVVIDVPEDGGQAGNGFESNWSDSYRNDPRYHSIRTSTSPSVTRPESPKPSPAPQAFPSQMTQTASHNGAIEESIAAPTTPKNGLRGTEIRRGQPRVQILTYRSLVNKQSFVRFEMSADAHWAAVVSSKKIYVYDLQAEKLAAEITTTGEKYLDAAFLHHESKLVTLCSQAGGNDPALSLWDLDGLRKVASWKTGIQAERVAVCADDQFLAMADRQGTAIMATFRNSEKSEIALSPPAFNTIALEQMTALAVDPLGRYVVVGLSNGKISMLNVFDNSLRKRIEFTPKSGSAVRGLYFSPTGRDLATCGDDGHIYIWQNLGDNVLSNPAKLRADGRPILDVALGFDGILAIGANGKSGAVLWDTLTNRTLDRFSTSSPAVQVAFSESASKFAIVSDDGEFVLRPIIGPGK
ncbi:WD40 repeat domain-containing protein [Blastopirellula marina]|uniref:Uncharacterized protein n=1 Tax=Blastopirellula marina TaxID=124 RepID=A0A2S8GF83_9BACT|nr:hypothetical protein [Blastopirellula marina]PQO42901.1 hypothetical protein C5Y93_24565 [Blastopirellula marina]